MLHEKIEVARGTASRERLRTLLTIHKPAVVFQLASVPTQPSVKVKITADLLAVAAEVCPTLPVIVPLSQAESRPRFNLHTNGELRLGFVNLPTLFGEGAPNDGSWTTRLFTAATDRQPLPPPVADGPLTYAPDAADSLLAAAEALHQLAEPPVEGLWLEPTASTTTRKLFERVSAPLALSGNRLGEAVRNTLAWYERQPRPSGKEALTTRAAA